jgi:hypothetical protein
MIHELIILEILNFSSAFLIIKLMRDIREDLEWEE